MHGLIFVGGRGGYMVPVCMLVEAVQLYMYCSV